MKTTASKTTHSHAAKGNTKPIKSKDEVQSNPDNKIDEDFPGFPHSPSKEEQINPKTKQQKKVAGANGNRAR